MNKVLIATVLSCSALASAAFAADRPRHVVVTQIVRTDDLDLNTAAGAAQMFRRITGAVDAACYQTRSDVFPWASYEVGRCSREAIARAVRDLKAPLVTAAFDRWSGAPAEQVATR